MGRAPCCEKVGVKRGPWTPQEDVLLIAYIHKYGHDNWRALPKHAGLLRCGKSCRLRWINYLRPDIKRGNFTPEEEETIIKLHGVLGNKWSKIAAQLPGRTDNEIKNVWHTHLKKRLQPINEPNTTSSPKDSTSLCSNSSSSSSLSLLSLNQSDETQIEEELIKAVSATNDHAKTEETKKCPLSEILVQGSSSSEEEDFSTAFREYAGSTSLHYHETDSPMGHSPSTSITTSNSCKTGSNIGQYDQVITSATNYSEGPDICLHLGELSDEANFADIIWDTLEDDLKAYQLTDSEICLKSEQYYDEQNTSARGGEESKEVVGVQSWLLELEPGEDTDEYLVKGDSVQDEPESYFSIDPSPSEVLVLEFEVDPIVVYFQSL